MVNYSFSTILMTFLASNLIIILITMCFRHEKILLSIGYKLVAVFLVLTILRVMFPFELPFARNVYLPTGLSALVVLIRHHFFKICGVPISLWMICEAVWIIGFLVKVYGWYKDNRDLRRYQRRYGVDVTNKEPYQSILAEVCGNRKNHFRILKVPRLDSPRLMGVFRPIILLPREEELSQEELYYTFRHETFHHYHHDLLIKCGVKILCMVYWWNPACGLLQEQLKRILEMHVDDKVTEKNGFIVRDYIASMIHMMEVLGVKEEKSVEATASIIDEDKAEMNQRFNMLCNREKTNRPMFLVLFVAVFGIYLGSYGVTVEADYILEMHLKESISSNDGLHAILQDDGTYGIYYGEIFLEYTDTLEDYASDILVYKNIEGGFVYE